MSEFDQAAVSVLLQVVKWTALAVCFLSAVRWVLRPITEVAVEEIRRWNAEARGEQ